MKQKEKCRICGTELREFYPKGEWFCDLCGLTIPQQKEFLKLKVGI